jgi:hypothetical protein
MFLRFSNLSEAALISSTYFHIFMPPFEEEGVYCSANVGLSVGRPHGVRWLYWKLFITKSSYFTLSLVITSRWLLMVLRSLGQMSRSQGPKISEWSPLIILKSIHHKVIIFLILIGHNYKITPIDFGSLVQRSRSKGP